MGSRSFSCATPRPRTLPEKQKKDAGEPEHESDVKVITRAIYRFNGTGYVDPKHTQHIWILDLPASADAEAAPRQLTSGAFDERGPTFTADGKKLLYYTNRNPEPYYELPKTDIMSIATSGGTPESLATLRVGGLLGGVGEISLSPNGKSLAFVAGVQEPVRSYTEPDMWVLNLDGKSEPINLTAKYDYDMGSGVGGDNRRSTRSGPTCLLRGRLMGRTFLTSSAKRVGRFWFQSMRRAAR